jgi:prepilin-type N-terminal cleavage/methylation domain-containing protein
MDVNKYIFPAGYIAGAHDLTAGYLPHVGVSVMLGYNRCGSSHLCRLTPSRSKTGPKGFSLIEMLVVISILAIVAAAAIPNLIAWRSGMQFRAAVNDLRNDLESAKTRAVKENAKVTVAFNPTAGQYDMSYQDPGSNTILLKTQTLPAGVRINSDKSFSTSFSSRGTADTGTIVLTNQQGKTKSISISFIGKIEVKDGS